ncbi:hypothetical protein GQ53DRAFT_605882, partial [Thozetella sp. PMI_491]
QPAYTCENLRMRPKFLSYNPIMVYIENFLTPYEVEYLKEHAIPRYEASTLQDYTSGSRVVVTDQDHRKSDTAWLDLKDPVVSCIRRRAMEFEGVPPKDTRVEIAAIRYKIGGQFGYHYDWAHETRKEVDRKTSFFAILDDNCTGGTTYFPFVQKLAWGSRQLWCDLIQCDITEGVAIKALKGNALFWVNFHENGTGHHDTMHAGAPVMEGTKIGLNIW